MKTVITQHPLRAAYMRLAAECVRQLAEAPSQIAVARDGNMTVCAHGPQPYTDDMPAVDIFVAGPVSPVVQWVEGGIRYRFSTVT